MAIMKAAYLIYFIQNETRLVLLTIAEATYFQHRRKRRFCHNGSTLILIKDIKSNIVLVIMETVCF